MYIYICDICCVAYIWRQIVLSDDFLVTLEHDVTRVVMTSHEYWAGDAGGDAWSARLSEAQLESGVWRDKTYQEIVWPKHMLLKSFWLVNLYYTTGNISDVYYNVYYEADGPCVCIDVKTWMDLRCSDVNII